MTTQRTATRRAGISLPETLVVIGLIGLLLSMLLPAIQHVRETANKTMCAARLRDLGIALHSFHNDHKRFPMARTAIGAPIGRLSWYAHLLPYVGEQPHWQAAQAAIHADPNPINTAHDTVRSSIIKAFVCPTDDRLRETHLDVDGFGAAFTSYLGVAGGSRIDGIFQSLIGINKAEVTDGLSNTLMVGERPPPDDYSVGRWYTWIIPTPSKAIRVPEAFWPVNSPYVPGDDCNGPYLFGPGRTDNVCDRFHFWSLHPRGGNWLFGDGSVRFLPYSARDIIEPLATRAGREVVTLPD